MKNSILGTALRVSLPVFFGYIAIGIPFGLMMVNAGYPWWLSVVMSVFMYAGAGQYVAVGLFASGANLSTIILVELLVNIRHIVYGLSILPKFKVAGRYKFLLICELTDETYALLTGLEPPKNTDPGKFYGAICILDHSYWILGSLIGAVAGTLIPYDFKGVDFALTTLFAVLLTDKILQSKDFVPAAIGILVTVGTVALSRLGIISGANILIVALAFGIAALTIVKKITEKSTLEPAEVVEGENAKEGENAAQP